MSQTLVSSLVNIKYTLKSNKQKLGFIINVGQKLYTLKLSMYICSSKISKINTNENEWLLIYENFFIYFLLLKSLIHSAYPQILISQMREEVNYENDQLISFLFSLIPHDEKEKLE